MCFILRFLPARYPAYLLLLFFRYGGLSGFARFVPGKRVNTALVIAPDVQADGHRVYAQEFRNFIGPFPAGTVQHGLYAHCELMPDFSRR
jgi:hypothetical protein